VGLLGEAAGLEGERAAVDLNGFTNEHVSGLKAGTPSAAAISPVTFSIMNLVTFSFFFMCLAKPLELSSFGSLALGICSLPSLAPGPWQVAQVISAYFLASNSLNTAPILGMTTVFISSTFWSWFMSFHAGLAASSGFFSSGCFSSGLASSGFGSSALVVATGSAPPDSGGGADPPHATATASVLAITHTKLA
jgi:hypothetical protein